MVMRTDPFRELDRMTQQIFGPTTRSPRVPMDSWRDGDTFVVALDLPGVDPDTLEVDVDADVLSVRAERPERDGELVAAERPHGVLTRRLVLGDALDPDRIEADYRNGVLTLRVPFAEQSKPRKIEVTTEQPREIAA